MNALGKNKKYQTIEDVEVGTLIEGTLLLEDLIPTFEQELSWLGVEFEVETPYSYDYLEYLNNLLNEAASDGYYFGARPGDGSDFGFWIICLD